MTGLKISTNMSSQNLRYVFLGGQESLFAEIILQNLKLAGWEPLAAIRNAKAPLDPEYLQSLQADFFLVAAFAKILKKEIIGIPLKGTVGVHPSLLPQYRGASPIQSALLNDEKITGTSIFIIDEKVDHGPIVAQEKLPVTAADTYATLLKRLAELSSRLCLKALPDWLSGDLKPTVQDEAMASYTKKFNSDAGRVDLKKDRPKELWLKIRALNPEPSVYAMIQLKNGKEMRLKLLEAKLENSKLRLIAVQPEGKKPMPYQDFLNGYQKILI